LKIVFIGDCIVVSNLGPNMVL